MLLCLLIHAVANTLSTMSTLSHEKKTRAVQNVPRLSQLVILIVHPRQTQHITTSAAATAATHDFGCRDCGAHDFGCRDCAALRTTSAEPTSRWAGSQHAGQQDSRLAHARETADVSADISRQFYVRQLGQDSPFAIFAVVAPIALLTNRVAVKRFLTSAAARLPTRSPMTHVEWDRESAMVARCASKRHSSCGQETACLEMQSASS